MKKKPPVRQPLPYILLFSGLIALAFIAYGNTFNVPFVFDDLLTIQRNTGVRFGEYNWNLLSGRSLLYLTFTLNYIWTAQEVWSYHLVNLAIHTLNGLGVFMLGMHIFRRIGQEEEAARMYATFAAAFFLVHPVQTESVTYISSRSELLSGLFFIAGFLVYTVWPWRKGFLLGLAVAVPFLAGMLSKETVIALPVALVAYELVFSGGLRHAWRFFTMFGIGAAYVGYWLVTGPIRFSVGVNLAGHLSSWHYFLTQTRVLGKYLRLVFWPVNLNLDYDFQPSMYIDTWVLVFASLHVGLLIAGWLMRKRHPVFAFSIFWFYICLAPTSSFLPILDVIFEHRMYIAMVGMALAFPLLCDLVVQQTRKGWYRCVTALPSRSL